MDMHEQEFVPEPQAQSHGQSADSLNEHEIQNTAQPYYWSIQKPNAPKDEPASLYDDPMVQGESASDYTSGYSGHGAATPGDAGYNYTQSSSGEKVQSGSTRSRYQQQQYSPDGDSFEHRYQYQVPNQQWNVPWWARPQAQSVRYRGRSFRWFWLLLLALLVMAPLLHPLGLLLVARILFLALLIPFLFILVGATSLLFLLSRLLRGRTFSQRRRWW